MPVLSKIIVSTFQKRSKTKPPLTKTPFLNAAIIPDKTASGVIKVNSSGEPKTSNVVTKFKFLVGI